LLLRQEAGSPAGDSEADRLQSANTLSGLASRLQALGRLRDADALLNRAFALHPFAKEPWFAKDASLERARLDIQMHRWKEANDHLKPVARARSWRPEYLVLRASVQERRGHVQSARRNIAKAAAMYQDDLATGTDSEVTELPNEDLEGTPAIRKLESDRLSLIMRRVLEKAVERERWADAAGLSAGILDFIERRADVDPVDREKEVADAHLNLGWAYWQLRQLVDAEQHLARAVCSRRLLTELKPSGIKTGRDFALCLNMLGVIQDARGMPQDAASSFAEAVGVTERLTELAPEDVDLLAMLGSAVAGLGSAYAKTGRLEDAFAAYARVVDIWQVRADRDPTDAVARGRLADAQVTLGWAYWENGRYEDASLPLTRAFEWREEALSADPSDRSARSELAMSSLRLGLVLSRLADAEAVRLLTLSVVEFQRLSDEAVGDLQAQDQYAAALALLGSWYAENDRLEESADCLTRAVNVREVVVGLDPGSNGQLLVLLIRELVDLLRRLGRDGEAERLRARADELGGQFPGQDV
jgi:tetratricopeptide (TPR) repeat protein